jgi:hypothetical protein
MGSRPMSNEPENRDDYVVVAPDGCVVRISKEFFDALRDFLCGTKPAGSLVAHFRNGGFAGLEASIKKLYK